MVTTILVPQSVYADDPSSSNYKLNDYAFGAGGSSTDMGSESFNMYGFTGEDSSLGSSSSNFTFGGGLLYGMQASTPEALDLTNPHNYYDRLKATLDSSSDIDGTTYAIAISDDDFVTAKYVTDQGTLKDTLEPTDFYSYDQWGGAAGVLISGLYSNTTYKAKVSAIEGENTQSDFSEESEADTELPTLTFTLDGNANMGNWNENNNYGSTAISTLTTSTNAYNGYSVYAFATQPLTRQNGSETIANYTGTYANPGSWLTGQGFGYTTNDTLVGGTAKWNAATCPADGGPPLCYAAFSQTAPGDIVVDHQDPLTDGPLADQEFELTYKVVTQSSQTAGTYSTSIIYTIVPVY